MQIFKLDLSTINEFGYKPNYTYTPLNKQFFIPYGEDNKLDKHLGDLLNSPTHSSLLLLEQNLVFGDSFLYDESNTKLKEFISENDLDTVLDRSAHDFVKYGGFYLQIIWSKDGNSIAKVQHQDFSTVRINNELVNDPNLFWISFDWENYKKYGFDSIPKFDQSKSKKEPQQLLYTREYNSTTKFYPKIPYQGGIKSISIECDLEALKLNSINNNLTSSGMFIFKEVNDPEERKALKNNLKKEFTGVKGGKYIAVFSQSKDTAPEFIPIDSNNNSEMYITLNDITVQKILTSHRLSSPALAGLPSNGSIFTNEISTGFEYYQSLVIRDFQQPILKAFNKIFLINKLIDENSLVTIKNINPIQFKTDSNVMQNTMTINEIREKLLGLPPMEDGNIIVNKNGNNPQKELSPTTTPVNDITKTINPKDK